MVHKRNMLESLRFYQEEELPSINSNTTGDINGRGTTIV